MLRFSLAVLLVCASAQAMAQNGRTTAANAEACQDAETAVREDTGHAGAADAKAGARGKYAKPAHSAAGSGGSSGSWGRTSYSRHLQGPTGESRVS